MTQTTAARELAEWVERVAEAMTVLWWVQDAVTVSRSA
ncbi:DUF3291 domain-containing protein [Streptomyces cellostaticus]|nr:DUF3291 domain-containing protein [Streptomyces cellostaticus]